MKRNFFWMLVTILALCSGTVFMSCSDKENTDSPQIPEQPTMPKITEDFEDFATIRTSASSGMRMRSRATSTCCLLMRARTSSI